MSLERTANPSPVRSTASAGTGLTRRDFFADVVDRLRSLLPEPLTGFRHQGTSTLLKVSFSNERIHYEVWTNGQLGTIEVGLHFEDGPVSTAAYLAYFDRHIVELKHELGAAIELERWTASWGHVYELLPLTRLDGRLVERVARRLAALITTLQPLVEAAAIPAERGGRAGRAARAVANLAARPRLIDPSGGGVFPDGATPMCRGHGREVAGRARPWRPPGAIRLGDGGAPARLPTSERGADPPERLGRGR